MTESGEPARRVRVTLQQFASNRMPAWFDAVYGQTDAEGAFEFPGLLESADKIRASVVGREGAGASEPFKLERGSEVKDVLVILAPPAVVEGTVRNQNGQPVPGARVWIMNWDLEANRQRDGGLTEALTDRNGRYRHVGVDPGGHWLECFLDARQRRPTDKREPFEVKPGSRVERDLVLPEG